MTLPTLLWVFTVLGALFAILSWWQERIDRMTTERSVTDLQEADKLGTRKAIAQHPQIDASICIGCGSCVAACPEHGVLGLINGISTVIHGSRCIGHARCELQCPVGALTVSLGDVTGRSDLPVLTEEYETTIPGLYIAGELGGIALIRNAFSQGIAAVTDLAESLGGSKAQGEVVDVLIVGSGPAGLAASLKAKELGLKAITVDQSDLGGTVRKYPRQKLVMTQPFVLPLYGQLRKHEYIKEELIEIWDEIAERFELDVRSEVRMTGCVKDGDLFRTETSAGTFQSHRVVLALGRRGTPRKLGVSGESGEKVLYQLIDAASYQDKHILVVGGGDSAIEAAIGLARQSGNKVTLSYRKEHFFRIKSKNAERLEEAVREQGLHVLYSSQVERVLPDSVVLGIKGGSDGTRCVRIANDFVFVFAGGNPPYPLLKEIGIKFGDDLVTEEIAS